jgi:hypothetical protein
MASSATSIDEIAESIRQAGADRDRLRETMSGLYADTIELAHEPPLPSDGPIPSRVLIELGGAEVAAVERALRNPWLDAPDVIVEGDRLRVRNRMGGILADGTDVEVCTNTVYTIGGGRIVGLRSEMAPEDMERWGSVLAAGDIEIPAGLFSQDPRLSAESSP